MSIRAWLIFIAPILSVFVLSPVFFELLPVGGSLYSPLKKGVFAFALFYAFFHYHKMENPIKVWFFVSLAAFGLLMLESYGEYRTLFKYPHVFSKILSIFLIFFIYSFYKANPSTVKLKHIVFVILLAFTLNLFFINNRFWDITSGFLVRERIIDSHSSYLILLPFFYFFNRYLETRRFFHILLGAGSLFLIILLQYRTLWVAVPVGMAINLFLLKKATLPKETPILLPFLSLAMLILALFVFLLPGNDRVVDVFVANVQDIVNAKNRLAYDWRWMQFSHYWPFIQDNFLFGLRFEGYEMPVMVTDYTDNYDLSLTGDRHWFHSFFIDKLFYLGALGLGLFILPPLFYIYQKLVKADFLNVEQLSVVSFVATGLLYGISYVWPLHYYALLGFALYLLDMPAKSPQTQKYASAENLEEEKVGIAS